MSLDILTPTEVRSRLGLRPRAELQHIAVSTKPWGNFKAADYTPQQWKAACLIVRGDGSSKIQCSLPVREPDGTLNKNALSAAAAALAGARGGVIASTAEKAAASKKLLALYNQVNATPPASLTHNAIEKVQNFLAHFGIRGMKWGVRRDRGPGGTVSSAVAGGGGHDASGTARQPTDFERARAAKLKAQRSGLQSLSNSEIQTLVSRMNLERQFDQMTATRSNTEKGRTFVKEQLKTGKTINEMIAFANSPAGHLLSSAVRSKGVGRHAVGKHAGPGNLRQLAKSLKP